MNHRRPSPAVVLAALVLVSQAAGPSAIGATSDSATAFKARFLQLCDSACIEVNRTDRKDPFFIDSYAGRALCAAHDLTGRESYLDACKTWSDRMVAFQAVR